MNLVFLPLVYEELEPSVILKISAMKPDSFSLTHIDIYRMKSRFLPLGSQAETSRSRSCEVSDVTGCQPTVTRMREFSGACRQSCHVERSGGTAGEPC